MNMTITTTTTTTATTMHSFGATPPPSAPEAIVIGRCCHRRCCDEDSDVVADSGKSNSVLTSRIPSSSLLSSSSTISSPSLGDFLRLTINASRSTPGRLDKMEKRFQGIIGSACDLNDDGKDDDDDNLSLASLSTSSSEGSNGSGESNSYDSANGDDNKGFTHLSPVAQSQSQSQPQPPEPVREGACVKFFADPVSHICVIPPNELSDDERSALFYRREDFRLFRREFRALLNEKRRRDNKRIDGAAKDEGRQQIQQQEKQHVLYSGQEKAEAEAEAQADSHDYEIDDGGNGEDYGNDDEDEDEDGDISDNDDDYENYYSRNYYYHYWNPLTTIVSAVASVAWNLVPEVIARAESVSRLNGLEDTQEVVFEALEEAGAGHIPSIMIPNRLFHHHGF